MLLTDTALNKLKAKDKPYTITDTNGLCIYVSCHGTKSWHFRYGWEGKASRITLGQYPKMTLSQARAQALKFQQILVDGINPKTKAVKATFHKGEHEQEMTFAMFVPEWKEIKFRKLGFIDPRRRNSTQVQIERYLNKDILPVLGKIPLKLITRPDILRVLRKMESRGAYTPAEKCRCWLNEIFLHAMVVGYIDSNPASEMHIVAEPKPPSMNNPHLKRSELPAFLDALDRTSSDIQNYLAIKLLLLTGVRPGELRFARPDNFDVENELWTIPAAEVKQLKAKVNNEKKEIPPYLVPLSKQAVEVVKKLLSMCYTRQEYLIVSRFSPQKAVSENTFNLVLHRIGYKGRLTTHGIRGTISTALYELNYPGQWIESQLSHSDPNLTRRAYNHAEYVPQRRKMMQDWADMLDKCRESQQ